MFAFYLYDKAMMRSPEVIWSTMIFYLAGMFWATSLVSTPFIVFLITNAYFIFFFLWIMNVYDAELLQIHQELTHQEMLDFHKGTDKISEVRKNVPDDYTPTVGASITKYVMGAIGGFILSFLMALVVRRT